MLPSPQTPSQMISGTGNVIKQFVRIRDIKDGVTCLQFGGHQLHYRGIVSINTVNFTLLSEEDQDILIEGFKGFLNGISFPIQILIRNFSHRLEDYIRDVERTEGDLAEVAKDHAQFVRQLAARRALVKRAFYIVVPADNIVMKDRNEALANAQMQIHLRIDEIMRQLERLGLTGHQLTDNEIIALYQSSFLSEEAKQQPITKGLIEGTNRLMVSSRDKASLAPQTMNEIDELLNDDESEENEDLSEDAPQGKNQKKQKKQKKEKKKEKLVVGKDKIPDFVSVSELVTPSCIQVFPWYMRVDGEFTHEYMRTLSFVNYPRSAYPGWLDSIIQMDEPNVDFSIYIQPLKPQEVSARLSKKASEFRGSLIVTQSQGKGVDPTTTTAIRDIEGLREKLARGDERVFNIAIFIQVRAGSKRNLSKRSNRITSAVRSLDFRVLPTHWQHHAGFMSCLPEGDNQLGNNRLFGTSAASTFYPFTGSDISMESGVLFGAQPNGNLIILNPFNSQELENANLVVFAKSGAGKSFFLKTTSARLLPTCNVYVIDPEAEYNNLCERVHGQYLRISSESLQVNPFDLYTSGEKRLADDDDESNFFREKLMNLVTMLELLLSDNGSLSQKEKAFLYRCLAKTYENRGITMDPNTHSHPAPNMQEFFVIMSSALRGDQRFGVGQDVYGLSERLERYVHLFPNQTRIALDNRFIDFNIRELNDTLKPIGLFLITEFLWTKMRQARRNLTRNTIVLIDEAWLLMQFPQGAKFLAEFARRIRKYGGGLWCTTQNSDDFLSVDEGRTILAMATMKFLMKQDATTIESVVRTFRLSPGQRNFLLSARRGEGLFATKSWSSMEVVASPLEAEMANTTLQATQVTTMQDEEFEEPWQGMVADLQAEKSNGNHSSTSNAARLPRSSRNSTIVIRNSEEES
jgi:type IV secretory pathway VirB4 component